MIVSIQGTLPISVLALSGVKGTLEDNAISIDARAVDNRKVNLESAMVKSWAGISRETVSLNSALSDQLAQSGLNVPGFLAHDSQKEAFVADAFPRLLSVIGSNTASGVYLTLGNDGDLSVEQDHIGAPRPARLRPHRQLRFPFRPAARARGQGNRPQRVHRPLTTPGRRSRILPAAACAAPTTYLYEPCARPPSQNPGADAKAMAYLVAAVRAGGQSRTTATE